MYIIIYNNEIVGLTENKNTKGYNLVSSELLEGIKTSDIKLENKKVTVLLDNPTETEYTYHCANSRLARKIFDKLCFYKKLFMTANEIESMFGC